MKDRQFYNRLIAGIIMIPIFIIPIIFGRWVLVVGLIYVVFQCLREYYSVVKENDKLYTTIGYLIGAVLIVVTYISSKNVSNTIIISALGFLIIRLIRGGVDYKRWLVVFIGALYLGLFLSFAVLIREFSNGTEWLITIFVGGSATDVFSYIIGKLFGKTKLAPRTSPGKTWEGFVGGLFMAILFVVLLSQIFNLTSIVWGVIWGTIIAFADLLGDLFASMIKRTYGVKDFGAWIINDAHGGLLDRIDGWLVVLPVSYMVIRFLLAG